MAISARKAGVITSSNGSISKRKKISKKVAAKSGISSGNQRRNNGGSIDDESVNIESNSKTRRGVWQLSAASAATSKEERKREEEGEKWQATWQENGVAKHRNISENIWRRMAYRGIKGEENRKRHHQRQWHQHMANK